MLGTVPTISINKTEGCQVYLSKDSLNCDIVSAKSSEMNILIPQGDDDYVSVPRRETRTGTALCLFLFPKNVSPMCIYSNLLGCFTEGVSSPGAVQDCVGRLQAGDRAH